MSGTNLAGTSTARTVGGVVLEARALLNDPAPSTGSTLSGTFTTRSIGEAVSEARSMLSDTASSTGASLSGTDITRTIGGVVSAVRSLLADPLPSTGSSLSGTTTTRTLGMCVAVARSFLQDPAVSTGSSDSGTAESGGRTYAQVISDARTQINDTVAANYRYADADLYRYLDQGLLQARRFRPDLFMELIPNPLPVVGPSNSGTVFPIAEEYYPIFVQFVIGSAEMRDDTYVTENKGGALLEGFVRNLQTAPYRHNDIDLYRDLSNALLLARRMRPDLFLTTGAAPGEYAPSNASVLFPIAEEYYHDVARYVAGLAKERDLMFNLADKTGAEEAAALQTSLLTRLEKGPYRYADADLYRYVSYALIEVRRMRPDLFISSVDIPAEYTTAAQATPFPVDERYYWGFITFAAGAAKLRDSVILSGDKPIGEVAAELQKTLAASLAGVPFRHGDAELYRYASNALLVARRLRPDLFLTGNAAALPDYSSASDLTTAFPLAEEYYPGFVRAITGLARLRDALAGGGDAKQAMEMQQAWEGVLSSGPWRYSDAQLYGYVSDALGEARRLRPDLFLGFGLRNALPVYAPSTDVATLFPVDERYWRAFVSFVVGVALSRDVGLKPDTPPTSYLAAFEQQLGR